MCELLRSIDQLAALVTVPFGGFSNVSRCVAILVSPRNYVCRNVLILNGAVEVGAQRSEGGLLPVGEWAKSAGSVSGV